MRMRNSCFTDDQENNDTVMVYNELLQRFLNYLFLSIIIRPYHDHLLQFFDSVINESTIQ